MAFNLEQIVKFYTKFIWNKCSGRIVEVREKLEQCVVELPDGKTRMVFGFHELEIKS